MLCTVYSDVMCTVQAPLTDVESEIGRLGTGLVQAHRSGRTDKRRNLKLDSMRHQNMVDTLNSLYIIGADKSV